VTSDSPIHLVEQSVVTADAGKLQAALARAERGGAPREDLLAALTRGLEQVRRRACEPTLSVAELLLSVDVFQLGLRQLRPSSAPAAARRRIVLGVVAGDVHDLGKNIVASLFEAHGHEVVDLGRDVTAATFLEALTRDRPDVLALSTMMSTTLSSMRQIIGRARDVAPRVAVLVGGAPLDAALARSLGADGYADSAATAPEELARLLGR
jgi:5-methyltetrahydrofolate--homocysteine methyltransferase